MIRARGVGKQFLQRWIFRDISLHVKEGSSLAILGLSGSGKSLLLKILAGLLPADEGEVQLQSPEVGMLFQNNALFDFLTVWDNLQFPLKEKRKDLSSSQRETLIAEMLENVELIQSYQKFPNELSGGMQKRLGIARALILNPQIIFYDEPTAGLDPITSRKISSLIRTLQQKQGTTVVAVTNDLNRAYELGDEIALLALGELISGGSPKEIRKTKDAKILQFIQGNPEGPLTEVAR